jgi:hypothetical protein
MGGKSLRVSGSILCLQRSGHRLRVVREYRYLGSFDANLEDLWPNNATRGKCEKHQSKSCNLMGYGYIKLDGASVISGGVLTFLVCPAAITPM